MVEIQINPETFNGQKLIDKYSLTEDDFHIKNETLFIIPDGDYDISDCQTTVDDINARKVDELWRACYNYVQDNFCDSMAMVKIVMWSVQYPDDSDLQAAIASCNNWADSVWSSYYVRKSQLLNGEAYSLDFSNHGRAPYSFIEISSLIG